MRAHPILYEYCHGRGECLLRISASLPCVAYWVVKGCELYRISLIECESHRNEVESGTPGRAVDGSFGVASGKYHAPASARLFNAWILSSSNHMA